MMRRRRVLSGVLMVLLAGSLAIALLYQQIILAAHARFPEALPDQLLYLVATPLPTALPAPTAAASSSQLSLISAQLEQIIPTPATPHSTTLPPTFTPAATGLDLPNPSPQPAATSTPLAPVQTPLPTAVRLENIDVIPQKFNNCGPANLAITLGFHGVEVDQQNVGAVIKPNDDDRNVSPREMTDYVNLYTALRARYFVGGNVDLLRHLLASGYPVIIEKGLYPNAWEGWMGHYLTIVGYDDQSQEFITLDTFLGPWDSSGRRDSYATVDEFWQQFNHTFILLYPPEEEDAVRALLPPELNDSASMWEHAAVRNQQLLTEQPENAYVWFNLGSSLTHLARQRQDDALYASAAAAFDQARTIGLPWRMLWYQFEPYEAYLASGRHSDVFALSDAILSTEGGQNVEETYLYRSQAFSLIGNETEAEIALAIALELNPNLVPTIFE